MINDPQEMNEPNETPEDAGRGTDTVMAHLSLGELVIPRAMLDDPQLLQVLQQAFQQSGVDMAEFTVGDEANKINPETGYPEFFKWGKIIRAVAPLALSYFAPGIGTALGGSLLGAGAAGASTLGNALIGGGLGALTGGGLKGAALGALTGGVGANLGGGSGILGNSGWINPDTGSLAAGSGSGILGSVGSATGGLSTQLASGIGGLTGGSGGGSSTFGGGGSSFNGLNSLASLAGGAGNASAIKKAQQQLLTANQQQQANLGTFDPSNITNDAGYQFNLQQGQQGLNRQAAAGGSLLSGGALKAASQYNQDYAGNALNSAYQRWLNQTGAQNQLTGNAGQIGAQGTLAGAQNTAQTLSSALNPNASSQAQLLRLLGISA